ncbi:MAG: FtsX-like permease family protein [Pseudomonadota bacterium]
MKLPLPLTSNEAERVVPHTGSAAQMTTIASAAMAFLCVFALALLFTTSRVATTWSGELAQSATIRISAPADQIDAQVTAVLTILDQTPGVATARALTDDEQQALLTPWFGPGLPLDTLPIPQLIEVTHADRGFDAEGLRLRLRAEVPGAVFDDHTRWRQPLIEAAGRLRVLGWVSIALIGVTMAVIVSLAASAALAANGQVIDVLRLIGARDRFVANAFVRRFTLRALAGSALGTVLAMIALWLMPGDIPSGFLSSIGFRGVEWLGPLVVPLLTAIVAFLATGTAARRKLRSIR